MSNEYDRIDLKQLADMVSYSAAVLARAPREELEAVEEDLREAALVLIPAAEFQEHMNREKTAPP
jgi:hypothetical protein